jgi:predicted MPP superfamily phosphohydrolase
MTHVTRRPIAAVVVSLALALSGCGASANLATPPDSPAPARAPDTPSASAQAPDKLSLPNRQGSLRFAAIGDTGTGGKEQYQIAQVLTSLRQQFPFEFVIMMGDNMYGSDRPIDYRRKFEEPYKALLDAGVKFYAALGNHDDPNQKSYEKFNMGGERFYSFKPAAGVRFFALDSNYMDKEQLAWLDKELAASGSDWKIAFFHHPLYSSGRAHGPSLEIREALEPLLEKHGVDVVFTGHEHFYERIKPQKGIHYFIAGASAKLRRSDVKRSDITAKAYDQDQSFMLLEIAGDEMHFQTIGRDGRTVDSGTLPRGNDPKSATGAR